jgi:hypothetical protein
VGADTAAPVWAGAAALAGVATEVEVLVAGVVGAVVADGPHAARNKHRLDVAIAPLTNFTVG